MSKRLLGPGLTQVYKVSPQLSAVLGVGQTSRQDALKGVWAYIKTKNLQNPLAKREIIADDTLAAVFGKKKVRRPLLSFCFFSFWLRPSSSRPWLISPTHPPTTHPRTRPLQVTMFEVMKFMNPHFQGKV